MRGINKAGLAGAGLAGAGLGLGMTIRYRRESIPSAPPPPRSPRASARERIIEIFPSLALGERVAISGGEARESTRGVVYAVDVYYRDRGEELTRLSSMSWPTEVEDWRTVERVEVLLENGSQVDFLIDDGIVVG